MAINNLYRAVEELIAAAGIGVVTGTTTGSATKFHFTSTDAVENGALIFTVFPAAPSASAVMYLNEVTETVPYTIKVDGAAITASSIKAGAAVMLYRSGTDLLVINAKSAYTATDVGLGNVTNESKTTMFTNPALTGIPTVPTAPAGTNNTQAASTAFVKTAVDDAKASPTFTGTPTAPTAPVGTNTTQVATTAFVEAALDGRLVTTTFIPSGTWTAVTGGYKYTLSNADVKAGSLVFSTTDETATLAQNDEYSAKKFKCSAQTVGSLTFFCTEATATIKATPIRLIIIEPR